jgi:uncharacterized protein YxjI
MTDSDTGHPAGWYDDPTDAGELRYWDGSQWTEHISTNGVHATAPLPSAAAPSDFTVRRTAQWRDDAERPLEIVGEEGLLGTFVPSLSGGAPGYRFDDIDGGTVIAISKPSLKAAVRVDDPAGYAIGTITKIGRLRSRYDITLEDNDRRATAKLASGAADEWELALDGEPVAAITRTIPSPSDALTLAEVEYVVHVSAPLDETMQRLVIAVPVAIDVLDTQLAP